MSSSNDRFLELLDAARDGDFFLVTRIVSSLDRSEVLEFVNRQSPMGLTALHFAAGQGSRKICQYLLECSIDVGALDVKRKTALHYAAEFGFPDIVTLLAESGSILDAKDNEDATPLFRAAAAGHLSIVDYLIGLGADLNCPAKVMTESGRVSLRSPVHVAVIERYPEILSTLIAAGAQFNINRRGQTSPLLSAVRVGDEQCVRILLENVADVNFPDAYGETPLMAALKGSNQAILQMVFEVEPLVNPVNKDGKSALWIAVESGLDWAVNHLLSLEDIDCRIKCAGGRTLVHLAVMLGNPDVLEALLSAGLEPDAPDDNGDTPLHIVARGEGPDEHISEIIGILMRLGCDPSALNSRGNSVFSRITPLAASVISEMLEDPEIVRAIADRKESRRFQLEEESRARRNAKRRSDSASEGSSRRKERRKAAKKSDIAVKDKLGERRPWGGSKETDLFKRNARVRLLDIRRRMASQLQVLEKSVLGLQKEIMRAQIPRRKKVPGEKQEVDLPERSDDEDVEEGEKA
jgi:ankyrin repeat protein